MIHKHRGPTYGLPGMESEPGAFRRTPDALSFPTTLTGTLPSFAASESKHEQLRQIAALAAVSAAAIPFRAGLSQSMRAVAAATSQKIFPGRADSQGRMDRIAMLTGKLRELVNPIIAGLRPLTGGWSQPRL